MAVKRASKSLIGYILPSVGSILPYAQELGDRGRGRRKYHEI